MKVKLKNIFQKKTTYIILLIVFTLLMAADIAAYALTQAAASLPTAGGTMPDFSASGNMQPPTQQSESAATDDSVTAQTEQSAPSTDGAEQSAPGFDGEFPAADASAPTGFLGGMKKAFWPILIVCLLADGASIFMLLRLRHRDGSAEEGEGEAAETDAEDSPRRSKRMPISLAILAALVVAIIALLPSGSTSTEATADEKLLSGTAEIADIDSVFQGSGTLTDSDAEAITVPDTVEVLGYTVRNGDSVKAGDALVKVDRSSVMETIASLQSAMDDLDAEIQSAKSDAIDSTLTATAAGRVMKIYAESGVDVQDTMYEHGALMLVSLDGLLAVDIDNSEAALAEGDAVTVIRADGSEIEGTVARVSKGTAKITVADSAADYGESVTVKSESGAELGTGELYINSELKVTGYSGCVSQVYVSEGSKIYSGQSLIALSDTDYTGNYSTLLKQREKYSEIIAQLISMYEDGYIRAENDGIVTGIPSSAKYVEATASSASTATTTAYASSTASSGTSDGGSGGMSLLLNITSSEPQLTLLSEEQPSGGDGQSETDSPAETTAPTETTEPTEQSTYTIKGTVETLTEDEETGKKTLKLRGIDEEYDITDVETDEGVEVGKEVTLTFETGTDKLISVKLTDSDSSGTPGSGETPDGGDSGFEMPSGGTAGGMSGGATETEEEFTLTEVTVCSLIPEDEMTISVSVDELDVLSLSVGQTAEVSLDALPGQSFTGTVTALNTTGTNAGGSTKYELTVTIDRAEQMLGGMNASVRIVTASKESVLTVPANAVYEEGSHSYVYTDCNESTNELKSRVEVSTGATDGENVEILDGLSEGDTYYYLYADSLTIS